MIIKKSLCVMVTTAVYVTCAFAAPFSAYAEGHKDWYGAWGVNRVVRTNPGFTGSRGDISITMSLPAESDTVTWATDPYLNKPTAYLGGVGPLRSISGLEVGQVVQVDAGLQFETGSHNPSIPPGWTLAISNSQYARTNGTGNYVNPKVWVAAAGQWSYWRGGTWTGNGATASISTILQYGMTASGGAMLFCSAFNRGTNTFYWNQSQPAPDEDDATVDHHYVYPWVSQPIFDMTLAAQSNVKRVVGMTREEPAKSELDGSDIISTWSQWQVEPVGSVLRFPIVNDINDAMTGYDAPGPNSDGSVNHQAYDRRMFWNTSGGGYSSLGSPSAPDSRTIVEFVNPNGATTEAYKAGMRAGVHDASRYTTESVNVHLGTATITTGNALEWTQP